MKTSDIIVGQKYYRINSEGEKIIYLGIGEKITNTFGDFICYKNLGLIIFHSPSHPEFLGRIVMKKGNKDSLKQFWKELKELN